MIWRVRKPKAKSRLKRQWHTWFAWYPVRVPTKGRMSGMHKVWLQKVQRKGKSYFIYDIGQWAWKWKYKQMEKEL
ncbi:MAG: hypothetical protein U9N54_07705 [candidate division Zixibacteria bacterium]|nr:hypothetical protein [candidate division Zixibacteria bacterium]